MHYQITVDVLEEGKEEVGLILSFGILPERNRLERPNKSRANVV